MPLSLNPFRIGRKLTLWLAVIVKLVGGSLATYAPEIISFCCGRFLLGMGSTGTYLIGFIIGRPIVGTGIEYGAFARL